MCHSRENGNPGRTGSRIKCGMTKRNVDPQSETIAKREDPLHLFRNKPHIGLTIHIKLHIDLQNLTIVDAIISDIIGIASQADIDHILRRDRRGN